MVAARARSCLVVTSPLWGAVEFDDVALAIMPGAGLRNRLNRARRTVAIFQSRQFLECGFFICEVKR
jgi:hypothetical protein